MNIYPTKVLIGIIGGFIGVAIGNLLPLVIAVFVFEGVDFITGCIKSATLARRAGKRFAFESVKAWRTIYKIVFILIGLVLCEILDSTICEARLRLADYFCAFVCSVEFWSFLENAAVISDHPIFRWLSRFMNEKISKELNTNIEEIKSNN